MKDHIKNSNHNTHGNNNQHRCLTQGPVFQAAFLFFLHAYSFALNSEGDIPVYFLKETLK